MSQPRVDVILPCLNEAEALPLVLASLPPGYHAIVVDNGSTDDSARIAREFGATVVSQPRRGYGSAVHAGLAAATADVVATCDADGSFDLGQLERVVLPVLEGEAELVLGRRRPRSRRSWPWHARLANRILSARLRALTRVPVHDLGPMRAARREEMLALGLQDRRSGYPLELFLSAVAAGWRVAEADVDYQPRLGRSKVTGTVRGTITAVHDMGRQLRAAHRRHPSVPLARTVEQS